MLSEQRLDEKAISQTKMKKFWENMLDDKEVKHYQKFGTVEAKLAKDGEVVNTVIKGEKETQTTTSLNDIIIKGVNGERYVVDPATFKKRYSGMPLMKQYQTYDCKGKTFAGLWGGGDESFIDSWGEDMIIKNGDYLCSEFKKPDGQLYRIEKSIFPKTYKLIK